MSFLLDFLPLLLFFTVFKYAEKHADAAAAFASQHLGFLVHNGTIGPGEAPILLATVVVIAATLVQVAVMRVIGRKIHLILWISLGLVIVLGGATVWFNNATFIKWKPTVAYWALALVFLLAHLVWRRNLLRDTLGPDFRLPEPVWRRLTWIWAGFFGFMGLLNLYVAYSFSTSTWAAFKAFGSVGLMLVFTVAQAAYISRHLQAGADQP